MRRFELANVVGQKRYFHSFEGNVGVLQAYGNTAPDDDRVVDDLRRGSPAMKLPGASTDPGG